MTPATAVILAGGRGERFWPLSTAARPKQLVPLFGGTPLLSQAIGRLDGLIPPERIWIITSRDLEEAVAAAAPSIPRPQILGEPCGRDTAAANALACALVRSRDPQAVACILTSDQISADAPRFRQTLSDAIALASRGEDIVTIGIPPTYPATGFGYIEIEAPMDLGLATPIDRARRFVEKPDAATAAKYVAGRRHFWNSGMFLWRTDVMRAAMELHAPDMLDLSDRFEAAIREDRLAAALDELYPSARKLSIDYAVMEHATNIAVVHGDFGWDDVGSWTSVAAHFPADDAGNVAVGPCETLESAGNIVVSEDGRFTALVGVNDLVVVHSGKSTLVCPKSRAQELKALLAKIAARPDASTYL
ncbi:MAG: mannose-1-phosphate guanylyltransferase [Kiritimatiellia bacterium]|jgi:mannose-1-phosphate guanylyltransferase